MQRCQFSTSLIAVSRDLCFSLPSNIISETARLRRRSRDPEGLFHHRLRPSGSPSVTREERRSNQKERERHTPTTKIKITTKMQNIYCILKKKKKKSKKNQWNEIKFMIDDRAADSRARTVYAVCTQIYI